MKKGGTLHLTGASYDVPVLNLGQVKRFLSASKAVEAMAAANSTDAVQSMMGIIDDFAELVHELVRERYPDVTAQEVLSGMDFVMLPGLIDDLALATHGLKKNRPAETTETGQSTGTISTPESPPSPTGPIPPST